jgi:hypothetical protein
VAEFDPDAFLKGTAPAAPAFDPDAFLKGGTAAPEASPREQELRAQYGKEIAQRGEPGYGERFIDAATMGVSRPLSGMVRGVGGLLDPNSTFGERYRGGVGAAEDYFKKGEENTAGWGGTATDVAGALAAPPVGKVVALPGAIARYVAPKIAPAVQTGGRELLGKIIAQGTTTGAIEGAARNAQDVGSAVEGGVIGGALGGATSAAVGGAAKFVPGVRGAQQAAREANQGATPEELKAAAKPLFQALDMGGIAYAQPQTLTLKKGIDDLITSNQYNTTAHSKISGYVDELVQKAQQPQGMGFNELSNLRSALAKEARGSDASTRDAAGKVIEKIDDLVLKNKPGINPTNRDVAGDYEQARKLWRSATVAEDVGWRAGKAERKAASKAGINPDEANRAAFRQVLEKVEKPGAYSPYGPKGSEQRDLLAQIVEGDKLQNTYRNLGAVAGSPGLRIAAGLGASALGLHGGMGPVVGALGGGAAGGGAVKALLDRMAARRGEQNIDALIRNITGSQPKAIPADAMRTLLAKQAAQRAGAAYAGGKLGEQ